eukprot:m51a1_g13838 hypothetical protein (574) ;mRNA; f:514676-517296
MFFDSQRIDAIGNIAVTIQKLAILFITLQSLELLFNLIARIALTYFSGVAFVFIGAVFNICLGVLVMRGAMQRNRTSVHAFAIIKTVTLCIWLALALLVVVTHPDLMIVRVSTGVNVVLTVADVLILITEIALVVLAFRMVRMLRSTTALPLATQVEPFGAMPPPGTTMYYAGGSMPYPYPPPPAQGYTYTQDGGYPSQFQGQYPPPPPAPVQGAAILAGPQAPGPVPTAPSTQQEQQQAILSPAHWMTSTLTEWILSAVSGVPLGTTRVKQSRIVQVLSAPSADRLVVADRRHSISAAIGADFADALARTYSLRVPDLRLCLLTFHDYDVVRTASAASLVVRAATVLYAHPARVDVPQRCDVCAALLDTAAAAAQPQRDSGFSQLLDAADRMSQCEAPLSPPTLAAALEEGPLGTATMAPQAAEAAAGQEAAEAPEAPAAAEEGRRQDNDVRLEDVDADQDDLVIELISSNTVKRPRDDEPNTSKQDDEPREQDKASTQEDSDSDTQDPDEQAKSSQEERASKRVRFDAEEATPHNREEQATPVEEEVEVALNTQAAVPGPSQDVPPDWQKS